MGMMQVEVRDNSVTIQGYVNIPERKSRVMPSIRGKFTESINGGVFQRAIDKADEVKLLFNHNENREIGSTRNNLSLKEDNIGLYASATVHDDEVRQLALDNKLTGWSFGFRVNKDRWTDGEIQHRTVEDLDLFEVSVLSVTPAYYSTKVEARDSKDEIIEHRAIDDIYVELKKSIKENLKENLKNHVVVSNETDEQRDFLCEKNKIETLLRIAKEKGQY